MTENDLLQAIYEAGKGKPMGVADIKPLRIKFGERFDRLFQKLDQGGYVDARFAVGQTRLTPSGLDRAEELFD